mmetsp:Transcript_25112/g.42109  ORF Transcript_25112/g.42109 Transcript_25112/m.42109 type:complete len:112 (+) Transcript_25112:79-414(+)
MTETLEHIQFSFQEFLLDSKIGHTMAVMFTEVSVKDRDFQFVWDVYRVSVERGILHIREFDVVICKNVLSHYAELVCILCSSHDCVYGLVSNRGTLVSVVSSLFALPFVAV